MITFRLTAAFAHLAPAVGTTRKAAVRLQRHHGYFYPSQVLCPPPSLCELCLDGSIFTTTSVIALHSATGCLPETESLVPGGSHGAYSVCAAVLVS